MVRGFDVGKKTKGRKRHIVTDALGLLIGLVVHGADVQDRDGAPAVLKSLRHSFPWLCHVFAKDFEKTIKSAEAWTTIAYIRLVTRRLARYCHVAQSYESDSRGL